MITLTSIGFNQIKKEKPYLVLIEKYNRYESGDIVLKQGTGKEIITLLKNTFDYDGFFEENGVDNTPDFLAQAQSMNGYGDDYIQIFEF